VSQLARATESAGRHVASLRVLQTTAYFDTHRGGIELVAGELARHLTRCQLDVTWLATNASRPPSDCGRLVAVSVAASNVTERRLGIPFPIPGPTGVATIWREVKGADVVLMHDSLYLTNVVAKVAARRYRKPVVLVQHIASVPYRNPIARVLMRAANALIARPMLRSADQVVFISNTVARHFSTLRFRRQPRLVFNGVDADVFGLAPPGFEKAEVRRSLGLPESDRPLLLFVGRFVEKKGLHIIESIARRRPDLSFALAGWGLIDPTSWHLRNVHVLSGLQGSTLAQLYQASDVFVLPSVGEGLPLVMQEALACGLPVICGRETAEADPAVGPLVYGTEIDMDNPDVTAAAFEAAIDRVVSDLGHRVSASVARERNNYARQKYSWAESASCYESIMNELVRPSRRIS
jgi:glycosyltransferase involved in cell wall biosynthesis